MCKAELSPGCCSVSPSRPSTSQASSPLGGHLHLAEQPSGPHSLPPQEKQAAVLVAEVGVERLEDRGTE